MEAWDPQYAYTALFVVSFLAATLLPLGSEWLVVALVVQGYSPFWLVVIATAGNTLGAWTTYAVGRWGGQAVAVRWLGLKAKDLERGQKIYARYGQWTLLFSWLPVVGDPFCAVSGFYRFGGLRFTVLVLSGKCARYIAVVWVAMRVTGAMA